MKVVSLILTIAILCCVLVACFESELAPPVPGPIEVKVVRVVDGDTIDVWLPEGCSSRLLNIKGDNLYEVRVRLADINAPERGERGYKEAKAALRRLLSVESCKLSVVRLKFSEYHGLRGKFGRLLAFVWVDGTLAQEALVREGLVRVYEKYGLDPRYRKRLWAAENAAVKEKKGIWKEK